MKQPFFSILLPTKNRSEIVGGAIESALKQTYSDFELIISDNDDSPTATAEAVAQHKDGRIQYVRTSGNLAMHENWDNAFNHAKGEHILILEDKIRLVPNALEIMHRLLQEHGNIPISCKLIFTKESSLPGPKKIPAAERLSSESVIGEFRLFSRKFFDIHPKGLNSCAPREFLQKAKEKSPTGFLYSHICPDYSSGFMLLSEVPAILYIDEPLFYIPNNWGWQGKYSNGASVYTKDKQIQRFINQLPVSSEEILEFVPVKTRWVWINSVIYDFTTKYRRAEADAPKIDWISYFGFCIVCVLMGKRVGGDMSVEIAEIKKALRRLSIFFQVRVGLNLLHRLIDLSLQLLKSKF